MIDDIAVERSREQTTERIIEKRIERLEQWIEDYQERERQAKSQAEKLGYESKIAELQEKIGELEAGKPTSTPSVEDASGVVKVEPPVAPQQDQLRPPERVDKLRGWL